MKASIWTRSELEEQIALYKAAIAACASGASYSIGNRRLDRQNLAELREHLAWLAGELAALEGGRGPVVVQARIPYGGLPPRKRA